MQTRSIFVVIAYPGGSAAQAARERLDVLGTEEFVTLELAAVVTKDASGAVKIERPGARRGLRLLRRKTDSPEIDDRTLHESGQALESGAAALCVVVHDVSPEHVVPELSKYGGVVIKTSLPPDREQLLKEAFAQQLTAEEIAAQLNR